MGDVISFPEPPANLRVPEAATLIELAIAAKVWVAGQRNSLQK